MLKPLPTALPSQLFYQSIGTLPLKIFIDVLIDGAFDKLIISGTPDPQLLVNQWNILQGEYNDALSTISHKSYLSLMKSIKKTEIDIAMIKPLIPLLRRVRLQKFCDGVNEILNTSYPFDYTNIKQYQIDLNKCEARTGSMELRLAVKKQQLKAIIGKSTGGDNGNTRESFVDTLIELGTHSKIHLDDSIMTLEFCRRVKKYNEYCEAIERKQLKR